MKLINTKCHRKVRRAIVETLEGRQLLTGTGLNGDYFDNSDLTTLKLTRVDSTVNFNWGTGSPNASVGADTFSVRWAGQIEPQYCEMYTFYVNSDDGARLWVDHQLILSNWMNQSATEVTGRVALQAGKLVDIKLEYFENTGSAQVALSWSSPSTAKQIIPQSQLYPTVPIDNSGSILQETWTNVSGTSVASLQSAANYPAKADFREYLTSFESTQQNWGDNYGDRVRGYLIPQFTGSYTFAESGDEEVQLWLSTDSSSTNAAKIAYHTGTTNYREFTKYGSQQSSAISLVAGQKYYVELLHKEGTGNDSYSVAWKTPVNSTLTVIDGAFLEPYGIGASLPASGYLSSMISTTHPHINATPDMFAKGKALIQSGGNFTTWYNNLKSAANSVVSKYNTTPLVDPYPGTATQTPLAALQADLTSLAGAYKFVGLIDGAAAAAQYATSAITIMKSAVTWHTWDGGSQFLGPGMACQGMALCLDWMYDAISSTDRQTIADGINTLALQPALATLNASNYWAGWKNNWTFVCAGGVISAGLAIAPDYYTSVTEQVISKSYPFLKAAMGRFTANNGGWDEGPGYQAYGSLDLMLMMSAMETSLGTDFGLSQTAGFSDYANFLVGQTSQLTYDTFWYNDGAWSQNGDPVNFWIAKRFGRTDAAWQTRKSLGSANSPFVFLYYDARGTTPGAMAGPTDFSYYGDPSVAPGIAKSEHVNTWLDSWSSAGAQVMFKGGMKGDNDHENLDAGSFIYEALGYRWATDLGRDSYNLPHMEMYRNRAEGQNTLVINPSTSTAVDASDSTSPVRVDQMNDSTAYSQVIRNLNSAEESVSIVDLSPAYQQMAMGTGATVQRGFRLDRRDDSLIVQDEINSPNASEVYWFMHYTTANSVAIAADGKSVTLTRGTQRLWMKILSGTNATFSIMDATPLPTSPNPSGQADNSGFKKLAIHLTGVTSDRLTVWMVPLKSGQAIPTSSPIVSTLSSWTPRATQQIWQGDIDGYIGGGASDTPTVDSTWKTQIQTATGKTVDILDGSTNTRVVPMTFNLNLPTGMVVTSAAFQFGLKSTSGSTTSDLFYLDSTSTSYSYSTLGWGTIDTTPTSKEYDLSGQLSLLQDGKLNIAFSGNTSVDWAMLRYTTAYSSTVSGTSGDDNYRLVRNGNNDELYLNGGATPTAYWAITSLATLSISTLDGNDSLTIDYSGGDPTPSGGVSFDGGNGTDTLIVNNTTSADTFALLAGQVTVNSDLFTYGNAEVLTLNVGSGNDTLSTSGTAPVSAATFNVNITAGKLTVASGSSTPNFSDLAISTGATFDIGGAAQSINKLSGAGTVTNTGAAANITIGATGGSSAFAGAFANGSGAIGVIKNGAGTVELSGASTFTGLVDIIGGVLRISNNTALGATSGNTTIEGGTTTGRLELTGGITISEPLWMYAKNSVSGVIPASILNHSGNNTIAGKIDGSFGGTGYTLESDADTLTISGNVTRLDGSLYHRPFQFRGAGNGVITGNLAANTGTTWGNAYEKYDAGTWTLSSVSTTGTMTINAGTLRLNGAVTNGSSVVVNNGGQLEINASQTWPLLTLNSGGKAALLAAGGNRVLTLTTLTVASSAGVYQSQLDLGNNAMILKTTGGLPGVVAMIKSGQNGVDATGIPLWSGNGLIGSNARSMNVAAARKLYAVGAIRNGDLNNTGSAAYTSFKSVSVGVEDVLVSFVYNGDTNLDGSITFSDYVNIDSTYAGTRANYGWSSGDFDFDGAITFSDYVDIDTGYAFQGASLAVVATQSVAAAQVVQSDAAFGATTPLPAPQDPTRKRRKAGAKASISPLEIPPLKDPGHHSASATKHAHDTHWA